MLFPLWLFRWLCGAVNALLLVGWICSMFSGLQLVIGTAILVVSLFIGESL